MIMIKFLILQKLQIISPCKEELWFQLSQCARPGSYAGWDLNGWQGGGLFKTYWESQYLASDGLRLKKFTERIYHLYRLCSLWRQRKSYSWSNDGWSTRLKTSWVILWKEYITYNKQYHASMSCLTWSRIMIWLRLQDLVSWISSGKSQDTGKPPENYIEEQKNIYWSET